MGLGGTVTFGVRFAVGVGVGVGARLGLRARALGPRGVLVLRLSARRAQQPDGTLAVEQVAEGEPAAAAEQYLDAVRRVEHSRERRACSGDMGRCRGEIGKIESDESATTTCTRPVITRHAP